VANLENPASDVGKAGFLNPPLPASQRFSVTSPQETRLLMLEKPDFEAATAFSVRNLGCL
jgi:hypothetical protein